MEYKPALLLGLEAVAQPLSLATKRQFQWSPSMTTKDFMAFRNFGKNQ
jgi:hypothetical protein